LNERNPDIERREENIMNITVVAIAAVVVVGGAGIITFIRKRR